MSDPYTTLGVTRNSTDSDIKSAFRKLAHKHHPDREGGSEERMKAVNEAYRYGMGYYPALCRNTQCHYPRIAASSVLIQT